MKGPKVVLIGAGSVFFARQTVWSMVSKAVLCTGTLALVDPDTRKLRWMEQIARRAIAARKVPLRLEVSTERREVLRGADFVILAFAREGVKLRGVDAAISTRHGMIMCSADTAGPGGIMRTLREVPRQNKILRDVVDLCPDARVINWVNPTAAMGIAMMRHFPKVRSLAICDGPHNPHLENNLMVMAGLVKSADKITDALRSAVQIRAGGINHFNWLLEMRHLRQDLMPRVEAAVERAAHEEAARNDRTPHAGRTQQISWQLTQMTGYVPLCIWHTQEYLPYFQNHDVAKRDAIAVQQWQVKDRMKWMRECWGDMQAIASGKRPVDDFLQKTGPDHASDIIEAIWAGLPKRFYINTCNRGAVPNMTDDAYLELPCVVDRHTVRPLPFGDIPRPLLGFMQRVLDEHELAVEAAVTCDRATLRKAFLASMVAVSIPDVEACMEEMLRRERAYLPRGWFR